MKKAIIMIFLFLFLFVGCSKFSNNNSMDLDMQRIDFIEIDWCGIDWEQIEFPIDLSRIQFTENINLIETEQDAIKIAKSFIDKCHEANRFSNYILFSIVHSKKDNIWRFDYSTNRKDNNVFCECLYVAFDGNNGELLKAWIEEG